MSAAMPVHLIHRFVNEMSLMLREYDPNGTYIPSITYNGSRHCTDLAVAACSVAGPGFPISYAFSISQSWDTVANRYPVHDACGRPIFAPSSIVVVDLTASTVGRHPAAFVFIAPKTMIYHMFHDCATLSQSPKILATSIHKALDLTLAECTVCSQRAMPGVTFVPGPSQAAHKRSRGSESSEHRTNSSSSEGRRYASTRSLPH